MQSFWVIIKKSNRHLIKVMMKFLKIKNKIDFDYSVPKSFPKIVFL